MLTKLPRELATGDRLVVRYGHHTTTVVCDTFQVVPTGYVIAFTDGSSVLIPTRNADVPVEVAR